MNSESSSGSGSEPLRQRTMLESVADLREQIHRPPTLKEKSGRAPSPTASTDATGFRPLQRPPMALLCVFDDGDEHGELIRIRKADFVIGRTEGDLLVPHDALVSGRHAEISRRAESGLAVWYLKDLGSTNGTFVRVTTALLQPDQVLLLGGKRYQFVGRGPAAEDNNSPGTRIWQQLPEEDLAQLHPALAEVIPGGTGCRYPLTSKQNWIGRDSTRCSVVLEDPMVSPKHARIYVDGRGRWCIQNVKSVNGVWAQISEVPLGNGGYFQCGEQRFAFRVL